MESEKQRIISEVRRQCEIEKQKAIDEVKKKQWVMSTTIISVHFSHDSDKTYCVMTFVSVHTVAKKLSSIVAGILVIAITHVNKLTGHSM